MILALVQSLIEKWPFTRAMAARERKGLNKGAVFGIGWLILRPFIQVAAYVLIVSVIFGGQISSLGSRFDYVLYVLSGMFAWQILQRGLEDSSMLIRDRMDILKQVVYPIETLPVSTFLVTAIGPAVVLVAYFVLAAVSGKLVWSMLLLPVPLFVLLVLLIGLSWIFMVLGVVLKDLREIIAVLLGLMVYFSPVVLNPAMISPKLWEIVLLNPISHPVIAVRDVLQGEFHPLSWLVFVSMAAIALSLGAWVVTKAKVAINEYI